MHIIKGFAWSLIYSLQHAEWLMEVVYSMCVTIGRHICIFHVHLTYVHISLKHFHEKRSMKM